METRELITRLEQVFGASVVGASDAHSFPSVSIKPESMKEILSYCLHDATMKFDFLDCITALDTEQDIVVIYHLYSTILAHKINIKVSVSRHEPKLASVTGFWRAAHAYEREAAEMFGIKFEGHPDLRNLLLADDWHGHPLRKDYVYPEEYHGIEHRRAPLRKEHVRP